MDTLFFFEKTKSRIEKWFAKKIRNDKLNTKNFLFTTFTT